MHKLILKISLATLCLLLSAISNATVFTVTNTNDSGGGSLRDALQSAAFINGPHTINFNIPNTDPNYNSSIGVWTISPSSPLPYIIKDNVTINGASQTSNQGDTNPLGPEIYLDGSNNSITHCFSVVNAEGTIINGFTISDFMYGIQIFGTASINSLITGNYIGTNATASDTAGNYIGIEIISGADYTTIGGNTIGERNIISGNEHIGIRLLDVEYCTVTGNYVGLDRTGTQALRNYDGISLEGAVKFNTIGGATADLRNYVSGNVAYGIPVFGAGAEGNIIIGNYIGTDITGTIAIPNTYGVLFDDGSFNNILGGNTAGERNILSGNSGYGVFIYNMGTHSNEVLGNYIGTDVSGTIAIPNAVGIVIDGAAYKHKIENNVISGNLQQGIYINITGCDSTEIIKNKIGVDINSNPLGNGSDGIRISQGPEYSIIGGSLSNANIIAHNGGNGVYVMIASGDYHLISYNSIYSNVELGIDLFPPGVNANDIGDVDSGPNQQMNFPQIDSVKFISGPDEIMIYGILDTPNPETSIIQIYKAVPDNSGNGQGSEYLTSVMPDVTGFWGDTLIGLTENDFLTTLAIDPTNNTSEFSIARSTSQFASVNENNFKTNFVTVFPNPSHGKIVVVLNGCDAAWVEIYSVTGEKVLESELINSFGEINLNLDAGIYFCRFITDGNQISYQTLILE